MNLKFIGTGSGKTSLKRFHSSILLSSDNFRLLVDTGDGISRALLKAKIDFNSIGGIGYTHFHPDHFSGLCALIVQMKMLNRETELKIYVHESLVEIVKQFLIDSYLLPEKMGFEIRYVPFSDNSAVIVNDEIEFTPRKNTHLEELTHFKEHSSLSFYCASMLFKMKNKKIHYTADIGSGQDLYLFDDSDINILISEITHITFGEIIKFVKEKKPDYVYLTHINEDDVPGLQQEIRMLPNEFENRLFVAEDGLSIRI